MIPRDVHDTLCIYMCREKRERKEGKDSRIDGEEERARLELRLMTMMFVEAAPRSFPLDLPRAGERALSTVDPIRSILNKSTHGILYV